MDTAPVKVNVRPCQTVQLAHAQAGSQQNHNVIIIVPTAVLHELQILLLLRLGQCVACIGILRHHVGQLELEGILADDIIVYSHFKCWPNNALHNANGILHYSFIVER